MDTKTADLEINETEDAPCKAKFDADEAARMIGLSAQQRKRDAILRGANQSQAAKHAGYSGDGANLRATGSKVAKSDKIKAYLAWARNEGAAPVDAPADANELKRVLSKHLRGSDKSASIRAAEVLHRLESAEAASRATVMPRSPEAVLEEIAALSEFCALFAIDLAASVGLTWLPKPPPPPVARERAIETLQKKLGPGAAAAAAARHVPTTPSRSSMTAIRGAASESIPFRAMTTPLPRVLRRAVTGLINCS